MFRKCDTCGEETLFTCEAVYDGFTKTGEVWTCSRCGTSRSAVQETSGGTADPLAGLFGDDDRPERVNLFDVEAETARSCRKCRHYVLHPFTQRCSLHDREVAATDCCPDFDPAAE